MVDALTDCRTPWNNSNLIIVYYTGLCYESRQAQICQDEAHYDLASSQRKRYPISGGVVFSHISRLDWARALCCPTTRLCVMDSKPVCHPILWLDIRQS